MWMIYHHEAIMRPGRKYLFGQSSLKYSFSSWEGNVESIFLLSTRTNNTSGRYADFIFVVKEKCRIGILATIQMLGELPDAILFTELCKVSKSTSIAIHAELLDSDVQEPDRIHANIRLFIAKKRSVVILDVQLSIEAGCLEVIENLRISKIPMTMFDPSHLVVTAMEERASPKFGIISGHEGTNIIRICPKKLQRELKIF
ncbi:hypothetical protein PENTCL1PPCAC_23420 [Pristionchus entomophagus]|uniref:Uncharacterized protein n=1 Tax=Pristionchus entomophagus TaxID=358040 RepID=A0AAV5U312_9BILA|nr:hypothetical protein PENTCL1PPCAC_23420 [Pristionchus entomophagus]